MTDIIETLGKSVIHHGKESNRVYLMKLDPDQAQETLAYIDSLVKEHRYTKIFAKIPATYLEKFEKYTQEAIAKGFYKGEIDGVFLAKYTTIERSLLTNQDTINDVIKVAKKNTKTPPLNLPKSYEFHLLTTEDILQITSLYKKVFETYPFPIFSPEYILKTMEENVCYFGIKKDDELVAISSAEMDKENLNAEMTDFATDPDHRGNGFSLYLLQQMEEYIKSIGFKTAYTIARSISYGMNITFARNDYDFGGTLINNTNISGSIESMNVWYKSL